MHRPRIGIPLTLDDRGRWRPGRNYHYIDRRYADAISQAGGLPLQLPIQEDAQALAESLDGLLIPGGDDFPSDRALPSGVELDLVADAQLAFDAALLREGRRRGLPILGICYGMQLIAREGGGELESHLPTGPQRVENHRLGSSERHPLTVKPGSRLERLLGVGAKSVNSLHHQAVRAVGAAHLAVAHSPDGVIEAIERVSRDRGESEWEIGVQWHPEKMDDDTSARLFEGFVNACRPPAFDRRSD